jgi:hypothetical protein
MITAIKEKKIEELPACFIYRRYRLTTINFFCSLRFVRIYAAGYSMYIAGLNGLADFALDFGSYFVESSSE